MFSIILLLDCVPGRSLLVISPDVFCDFVMRFELILWTPKLIHSLSVYRYSELYSQIRTCLKQEGEDLGYEGKEILEYVKEHQKLDREERLAWRNIQIAELQVEEKKRTDEVKIQMAQIEAVKEQAKVAVKEELALKELELKAQQVQATTSSATTPPPRNKDARSQKLLSFID